MTEATHAGADDALATAEEELSEDEFIDQLAIEGVTIDGSFYMPKGRGRQRRYFEYDPGLVKGFDSVREDGEVVAQRVANHDEALIDQVEKDHIMDVVYAKVRDGFGVWGPAVTESPAARDDSGGSEYEPMDDGEVLETIRENFAEHGFFRVDGDGDQKVTSLAHPDAKPMGYITGSHVGSLPSDSLSSVDDYRNAVFQALVDEPDEPAADVPTPGAVPIATDEMMETFREAGDQADDS